MKININFSKHKSYAVIVTLFFLFTQTASANFITATPSNYTGYLSSLSAGDTLFLSDGIYKNNLTLNGRNGNASMPIVIMGSGSLYTTIFQAQSCCNTVSITKCSYLCIRNLQLDGQNLTVDAVKAEGTIGNWAHHITIENLNIINYGSDQQNVGISTKCSAWNWIIRKNKIIGAGTGMYLGNSDGTRPFVNGIIENNYIANTLGYNIEIKHQLNGVRDSFTETMVNGRTIIRNNVLTKDNNASTGANARPNLLVGGFPTSGWGALDYYEIYGNFFFNNPVEALFQGTGNIMLYENIFVNHFDPPGVRAVYLTPQNGVSPQNIKVFHNTLWTINSAGGLRLYSPNTAFKQYCYANAVFAPLGITNFTDSLNNIIDGYNAAGNYILSASTTISIFDAYPKSGQLKGTSTPSALFQTNTRWDTDFNNDTYDWTYRGAYSGCCKNNGWHLQLGLMPDFGMINGIYSTQKLNPEITVYPNPFHDRINLKSAVQKEIHVLNVLGINVATFMLMEGENTINLEHLSAGNYFIKIFAEPFDQKIKIIRQ